MSLTTINLPVLISRKMAAFRELTFGVSYRLRRAYKTPFGMNLSFNVGDDEDAVKQNREIFFGSLGVPLESLATPQQCHSAKVQRVDAAGRFASCDALVTDKPRVFLAISVADCVPIFLYDPVHKAVAAVHAGWRGTAERITENAVQAMKSEFHSNPECLVAYIGPSAGVCCYEVGTEVASQFQEPARKHRDGREYLDLKTANMLQLLNLGVEKQNIEMSEYCTICNPDMFHSYRRDKDKSGRMMGVIGIV